MATLPKTNPKTKRTKAAPKTAKPPVEAAQDGPVGGIPFEEAQDGPVGGIPFEEAADESGGPVGGIPFADPSPASTAGFSGIPEPLEEDATDPGPTERAFSRLTGSDVPPTDLDIPRAGTTVAGAVIGGEAGLKTGVAIGTAMSPFFTPAAIPVMGGLGLIFGSAGGVWLGAGAPEVALEIAEVVDEFLDIGLWPEGTRADFGLSPVELETLRANEAILDMYFSGGISAIRGTSRGLSQLFTGADKEIAERAAAQGIDMTPVQVGRRMIGRGYSVIFGRFPFLGGGAVRASTKETEAQIKGVFEGLPDRIAPLMKRSKLGGYIWKRSKKTFKSFQKKMKKRYTAVWDKADAANITTEPTLTLNAADDIMAMINAKKTAFLNGGKSPPPEAVELVVEFIEKNILPMRGKLPPPTASGTVELGGVAVSGKVVTGAAETATQGQTLRAMDGLAESIDALLSKVEPAQKRFVQSMLERLRTSVMGDVMVNTKGKGALEIVEELKAIDKDFAIEMSNVFETVAANRIATVERRGLLGKAKFRKATTVPVDKLPKRIIDLDSPQIMGELFELVGEKTYKQIAASVIDDALRAGRKKGKKKEAGLDIEAFAEHLGLDGANPMRREAVELMLRKADSPLTADMLDDLVEAGRQIQGFDIPDVSGFIARRGSIGGAKAVIAAFIPGAVVAGGGFLSGGSFLAVLMFIGGTRLTGKVISNPLNARALHKVFGKEGSQAIKKKAIIEATVKGLEAMMNDEEDPLDEGTFRKLRFVLTQTMNSMDEYISGEPGKDASQVGHDILDALETPSEQIGTQGAGA